MSDEKKDIKLSEKLEKIAKDIERLTALELSDLSSYLEEKFGVSAMPMGVAAGPASASAEATADKQNTGDQQTENTAGPTPKSEKVEEGEVIK